MASIGLFDVLTFPGVVVHEWATKLFCRLTRVSIFGISYLRPDNPPGYVVHEPPRSQIDRMLIIVGPFVLNTVLGLFIATPGAIPLFQFGGGFIIEYLLIWLGFSLAMHAFPTDSETTNFRQVTPGAPETVLAKLGTSLIVRMLYGLFVALLLPQLLFSSAG